MKNKLLVLRGIPGSGKSTWAREFIQGKSHEWIIVNRDSIRNMMGDYLVNKREKLVTAVEKNTITSALMFKFNVVVDATNIHPKTIKNLRKIAEEYDVEFEIKDFEVDLETAIERDKNRSRTIGAHVVRSFHKSWLKNVKAEE